MEGGGGGEWKGGWKGGEERRRTGCNDRETY